MNKREMASLVRSNKPYVMDDMSKALEASALALEREAEAEEKAKKVTLEDMEIICDIVARGCSVSHDGMTKMGMCQDLLRRLREEGGAFLDSIGNNPVGDYTLAMRDWLRSLGVEPK